MADVAISAPPNIKVTGLSIKRTGTAFKATWKVPADASKNSNKSRWSGIRVIMYAKVYTYSTKKSAKLVSKTVDLGRGTTSYTLNINDYLSKIYPKKSGTVLTEVTCNVYAYNVYGGKRHYGNPAPKTFKMAAPVNPTLSITFDAPTNKATATVAAANDTTSTRQRTDSVLTVKRDGTIETGGSKVLLSNSASGSTNRPWSCVIPNADALTVGQWVRVDATAYSRGWRTYSGTVAKSVYIAHPTVPTCGDPVVKWVTQGDGTTASVLVPVSASGKVVAKDSSGKAANVWPETLYLHRLKNSQATTPTEAAVSDSWRNVEGAEATGTCTGLMDTWADGKSDPGKRTWYRIVAERDGHIQYGIPVFAECIYEPDTSGGTGDATIDSVASGTDGKSVVVSVSWTQASNDGVELSWSIYEDAWQSNDKPDTLDVDWGSNMSATATIRGLETGVPVFVKARCYDVDSDGNKTYSGYSAASVAVPYDAPENVEVTVPSAVVAGGEIPVEWKFDSDSLQQWADVLVDGVPMVSEEGGGHTVLGSAVAAAISTEGMELGEHEVTVVVSTDGSVGMEGPSVIDDQTGEREVAPVKVIVAEAPSGTVSVSGTPDETQGSQTYGLLVVDAQPVEAVLSTQTASPEVTLAVIADGCSADEMREAQADGEVVWSGSFSGAQLAPPAGSTSFAPTQDETVDPTKTYYELSGGSYIAVEDPQDSGLPGYYEYTGTEWAMVLPTGIDIRDTCGYAVRCTLTDGATGLSSAIADAPFAVKWAHQAVEPECTVTTTDLTASITVPAPAGSAQTDVVDLYRVTPGGSYLIASGRELGSTITDDYAPFRSKRSDVELRYRAVIRTADGDVEFSDVYYDLVCGSLRFDWESSSVELPYNINRTDSFTKDFMPRKHADGSIGGYWSPAVEHHGSLSTELIKLESAEQREALMAMANWAGPVFVRTPDGMAYCADASLGTLEISYSSDAVAVTVEASEVALVDSFTAIPEGD